ncbi:MAG TPA: hypothetical protein VGG92_15680 [Caulobacteraceae bacterium]|jgi:hypothetical protein
MTIIKRTIASAILLGGCFCLQGAAFAQSAMIGAVPTTTATSAPSKVRIPEGTEVRLRLLEKLSSSTSTEGDTFEVVTDEEIRLPDGTTLPAGYSGRGEVTRAEHNGWLGKSGQLDIRLDYMKVGDTRVHLRGIKGREGDSNTGNLIAATVLFGVVGFAVHGHSVVYPEGTMLTAYVDTDTDISLPGAPSAPPVAATPRSTESNVAAAPARFQTQQPTRSARKHCAITSPTDPDAMTCN